MASNIITQRPRDFFTLTQQYYNCCDLDGYVYFRDTDSQDGTGTNIGYLKWSKSDTEDPTDVGDSVSVRMTAHPGGMGLVIPVDCKLIKISQTWSNSSINDADQDMLTFTSTPPVGITAGWDFTLRDAWLINDSRYPISVANATFSRIANMGTLGDFSCTVTNAGSGYTGLASCVFSAPDIGDDRMEGTVKVNNMLDEVQQVTVTYEGSGYTNLPTVVISDPPSGTTATATVQSNYTWDRELSAGDHVILGFYSNDVLSPSPLVTGSVTWFFENMENY